MKLAAGCRLYPFIWSTVYRDLCVVLVCAVNSRKYRHYNATGTTPHTATSGCYHPCQPISQALQGATGTIEGCLLLYVSLDIMSYV